MLKLKEDLCGITQGSLLEKVILHGLNIIVSIIWGKSCPCYRAGSFLH